MLRRLINTTMNKSFAIIGGGIGGLTLAIAMQRRGFDVTVYERAQQIKPIGAGLGLGGNAVKAFFEIGIGDDVLEAGKIIRMVRIKDQHGRILTETDSVQLSARFGTVNNFTIHRADLHQVLMRHLVPGTLELNKDCIDTMQDENGVHLLFSDGTRAHAGYVIACDGIHSPIRKKLIPESSHRYAGYTCWRAVINDIPAGLNMDETSETWGPGLRFGIVPLSNNRLYWFACANAKQNDPQMRQARIPDLLERLSGFHAPIHQILRHTKNEDLIWSDIIDLKPLRRFAFDRIVLAGDAAHATTPNMAQGACMAIEDAAVMVNCLESYLTPEEAFRRFEAMRIQRTTRIVNDSWTLGKAAQVESPWLIALRNTAVRLTPASVAERQMKFINDVSFQA